MYSSFSRIVSKLLNNLAYLRGSKRYRALLEIVPYAVYVHEKGVITLANVQAAKLFGASSPSDLIGMSPSTLVDDSCLEVALKRTAQMSRPGTSVDHLEMLFRRLDGTSFPVEVAAASIWLDGSTVIQVAFHDITARKLAERALRTRTAELETVLETVPIAVWVAHDTEASQVTGNRQAAEFLRLSQTANMSLSAVETQRPSHFVVTKDGQELEPHELPLQRAARGEVVFQEELRVNFDDGSFFDELMSAAPVRDPAGNVLGAVGAAIDISVRKQAEEQIRRAALYDALTDLPNRTLFHDRLAQALARAKRIGSQVIITLLDLDGFKEVNDIHGHPVGDKLLREVAIRMRSITRESDSWARLGGDEFALIEENVRDASHVPTVAQRVLNTFRLPFIVQGHELNVGASLGIAVYPVDGMEAELLLRNADIALYRAKEARKGSYECYNLQMDQELQKQRSMERKLRSAQIREELSLVYQPIFRSAEDRPEKFEVLVRWTNSNGESILPSVFIPIAEKYGIIHSIGQWVLESACRQAACWSETGRPTRIAVNISPVQLRSPEFAECVRDVLAATNLPASHLELEITESVFLDVSKERIQENLKKIIDIGIGVVLDDFGTGYSSLAYLQNFPFDEVKIDGSFVRSIGLSENGGAIAVAIVQLAHTLGKRATAECVETQEQLDFLKKHKCDASQGFLLGHPETAELVAQKYEMS